MKKKFQIGEIARFFHLRTSALRYWEECGILSPKKTEENQYRTYGLSDLMAVSDLIFYRSIGIPLKEIRQLETQSPDCQKQLFEEKLQQLEEEKRQLQLRREKLLRHLDAVKTAKELQDHPYRIGDIDTDCIVTFDLTEQQKLHRYIENPYLYSRVQDSHCLERETRGLTVSEKEAEGCRFDQILWKKTDSRYAAFLMREEVAEGFPNDLAQHIALLQKTYRTGAVISRFLFRANEDGKIYDFYKSFAEVFPKEPETA